MSEKRFITISVLLFYIVYAIPVAIIVFGFKNYLGAGVLSTFYSFLCGAYPVMKYNNSNKCEKYLSKQLAILAFICFVVGLYLTGYKP